MSLAENSSTRMENGYLSIQIPTLSPKANTKAKTNKKPSGRALVAFQGAGVSPTLTQNHTRIVGFPRFNHHDVFPPMLRRTFNYTRFTTIVGDSTLGLIGVPYAVGLNSLYYPDSTSSHPYGYDQLLAAGGPYRRYKVLGVNIRVTAVSPGDPCYLITQLRNVVDTYTINGQSIDVAADKPGVRVDFITSTGSQSKVFDIKLKSLAHLFNWNNAEFSLDMGQTTGPYNGTPGSIPYLYLGACYPTVVSRPLDLCVEVQFDAVVYDRNTLV